MPELLGRLQSASAERYRLSREIGAGGMATVYLAEDVRHDRRVARFVMVRAATGGQGTELVVVQNWFEELKGRVGK